MDPVNAGDTAWLLTSTALVLLMVPALALFYGGLVSQRAVVSTMLLSIVSFVSISLVWSVIGYSLAFGPNPSGVGTLADGWTVVTADGRRSAHFEHTIALTDDGPEVLTIPG